MYADDSSVNKVDDSEVLRRFLFLHGVCRAGMIATICVGRWMMRICDGASEKIHSLEVQVNYSGL